MIVPTATGTPVTANVGTDEALDSDGTASGAVSQGPVFTLPPSPDADMAGNDTNPNSCPDAQTALFYDFGFQPTQDWGDLPDSFDTLNASTGAVHTLSSSLYLGACVDSDGDGVPYAQAGVDMTGGDDAGDSASPGTVYGACAVAGDDEDGVTFVTPLVPGAQACVEIDAVNSGASAATLYGWIDFNGDGAFTTGEALTAGTHPSGRNFSGGVTTFANGYTGSDPATNQFCFTVPTDATFTGGDTHMRCRLKTDTLTTSSWVGAASNGEVEDHYSQLACVGNLLWDDADKDGIQDAGEGVLNGMVHLVWAGPDGTVQTADGATTAAGDDVIYSVATAAGKYQFCGVVPGTYQIKVVTLPAGFSYATGPNAGAATDFTDSDGVQTGGSGSPTVIPAFTIASITTLPTGENGLSDGTPINSFPDNQENRSYDYGFSQTPTAVTLRALQAAVLELLRRLA